MERSRLRKSLDAVWKAGWGLGQSRGRRPKVIQASVGVREEGNGCLGDVEVR